MRIVLFCLFLLALSACTSPTITSETLSDSEISAISNRVQTMYPEISDKKRRTVIALAIRAMDNMVFVKGGSFMMGEFGVPCEPGSEQLCKSDTHTDNDFAHKVTLDDYYLSKFETTIRDFDIYRDIMGKALYAKELRNRKGRQNLFEPQKPAWTKNWQEVRSYCQWIGELTNKKFDLPTEAQWEYAARNRGQNVRYATDNGKIDDGRNYPGQEQRDETLKVGEFPPNPLGLYDMASNAGEWLRDWYEEDFYTKSPKYNPVGPASGARRVFRNISILNTPKTNTTVARGARPTENQMYNPLRGFRCERNSLLIMQ